MKKKLINLVIIMIVGMASALAAERSPRLKFRHFTTDNILSSNCVRAIVQDSIGYVWIATDGGLVRYDGLRAVEMTLPRETTSPAADRRSNPFVEALHASPTGYLWVATDAGLYRLSSNGGGFEKVEALSPKRGSLKRMTVREIVTDAGGDTWVSTLGDGIFRISPDLKEIRQYPMTELSGIVGAMITDSEGRVWAGSPLRNDVLFRHDPISDGFTSVKLNNPPSKGPYAMGVDNVDGSIWFGCWDDALVQYNPMNGYMRVMNHPRFLHIHSIKPTPDGHLLIGSDRGLSLLDPQTGEIDPYDWDELDPESITGQFIYPILVDREGGVWVGTYYAGANYAAPVIKQFHNYRHSSFRNSVGGNIVADIKEAPDGSIYVATDDGGVSHFDPTTGHFAQIALPGLGTNMHSVELDNNNNLWVGTYGYGVGRYNLSNHSLKIYGKAKDPNQNGLDDASCYSMLNDSKGRLWAGSMKGLNRYDAENDEFVPVRDLNAMVVDIEEDRRGRLWISTQGSGLFSFDPDKNIWKNYVHSERDTLSLPHNHVNDVFIDREGVLHLATSGGLASLDQMSEKFIIKRFTATRYPGINSIQGVTEEQGVLWLATSGGLVRYNPETGKVDIYRRSDGVVANEFRPASIMTAKDGRIYAGSVDGMMEFLPYQIENNSYVAPVVFTSLSINNTPVVPGDERLPVPLHALDELRLGPEDNIFTIEFSALSYANSLKNSYSYRLRGFDDEWHELNGPKQLTYSNLLPGTYYLEIRGSNNDGIWNPTPTTLKIKVMPPWWMSWLMQILYVLVAFGLVGLLLLWLSKRQKNQHRHEMEQLKTSTERRLYESKMKFFTMIAHEIRTPVSLIKGPLEKIMREEASLPAPVAEDLVVIDRNSTRLLELVNQLLDFKKVESSDYMASFRQTAIVPLLRSITDRFAPTVSQSGGELITRFPAEELLAEVDAEGVTKLVSNLLNNARKYMKSRVEIDVTASGDGKSLVIKVSDDGEGIPAKEIDKIFRPFYQVVDERQGSRGGSGIGLSIVKNVVEMHRGKIDVDSTVGEGTTFTVTLPLTQPDAQPAEQGAEDKEKNAEATADGTKRGEATQTASGMAEEAIPTMLVVDDNDELLEFIADSFADTYNVLTASDGEKAWEVLKKNPSTAIIVSDWMMPNMSGDELCRKVRTDSDFSHIPFIMLTAKTDDTSKTEGMNCGADAYVEKPFSLNYLEACLRGILDMRRRLRQRYASSPFEPMDTLATSEPDNEFLNSLNKLIEENLDNTRLSVDMIAEQLGISRTKLFTKVKELAGMSPGELVQLTRLKRAAQLLSSGQHRVSEVCYMVGFSSPSYFSKCFAKQFGMRPNEVKRTDQ